MISDKITTSDVTILIAEDSPTQAEQLKFILEYHGYSVVVAANGKEALATVRKQPPTLIITDVVMPEMDGYQLCHQIKNDETLHSIPVILLTSLSDPHDVIKGLECRADNFITKPFDQTYLISRIHYALANQELRRSESPQMGVEVYFAGQKHFITADRLQILNLLLSTYEAAVQKNRELTLAQSELRNLNELLEKKVEERTTALREEILERERTQEEVNQLNLTLEHRVQERTAQLQEANNQLEAFSYSISHDLRAPLRAINDYSAILLRDYSHQLDTKGQLLFNVIITSSQKMSQMIDDMLAFFRVTRQEMIMSNIDMEALVKDVYKDLRHTATNERIQFHIGHIPRARGDRAMIRQVLVNLLTNAIKFTGKKETPIIEVGSKTEETKNIYYIKDNGAGFDMKYADRLFGVFQRLHSEGEFEGTGIGLAIIHQIVHQHGGEAWAEAKVDEGATFFFSLPTGES